MDERRRRRAFVLTMIFAVVSTFIIAVAHRRRHRRQEREVIIRALYRQRGNWFMRDVVNGSDYMCHGMPRMRNNLNETSLMFTDDKATREYAQGPHTTTTQPPPTVDICEESMSSFAPTVDLDGSDASVGNEAVVKRKEGPPSSCKGKQHWKRSRNDDVELRELGSQLSSAIKNVGKEMSRDREEERNMFVMKEVMKFGQQNDIGTRDLFSMGKVLLSRPDDMNVFIALYEDLRMT